jgi:16S rRNA C1402 N4-methylase RsmH
LVKRKAIKPTAAELEQNPRARSAQLRVFEKL